MSGVNVEWHYSQTTIDPPELIKFIKTEHPDVAWERPKKNFFTRMVEKGFFPMRRARWCCEEYKEVTPPDGSFLILGIRAAESPRRRATWQLITRRRHPPKDTISPIIAWTDDDVWDFIRGNNIPYPALYDEGFTRLGCIGCPMSTPSKRRAEFKRWPGYERAWKRAFAKIWERRVKERSQGEHTDTRGFASSEEMFEWWVDGCAGEKDDGGCQGMLDFWS